MLQKARNMIYGEKKQDTDTDDASDDSTDKCTQCAKQKIEKNNDQNGSTNQNETVEASPDNDEEDNLLQPVLVELKEERMEEKTLKKSIKKAEKALVGMKTKIKEKTDVFRAEIEEDQETVTECEIRINKLKKELRTKLAEKGKKEFESLENNVLDNLKNTNQQDEGTQETTANSNDADTSNNTTGIQAAYYVHWI